MCQPNFHQSYLYNLKTLFLCMFLQRHSTIWPHWSVISHNLLKTVSFFLYQAHKMLEWEPYFLGKWKYFKFRNLEWQLSIILFRLVCFVYWFHHVLLFVIHLMVIMGSSLLCFFNIFHYIMYTVNVGVMHLILTLLEHPSVLSKSSL